MKKINIYLAEGFEEIEAITPVDVLRRAGFDVTTISITGNNEVKGAHGIVVSTDAIFEDVDNSAADLFILPGGMPGSKNLNSHAPLKAQLQKAYVSGKYIAAICAAPMVLGGLGLLKGKNATCYPGFEQHLEGAKITNSAVEVSDKIITANGLGSAMDFSLKLVELLSDKTTKNKLKQQMLVKN